MSAVCREANVRSGVVPEGLAALSASPRSVTDRVGRLGPFGVDTVAYRFRPGWDDFTGVLLRKPHRFVGGARQLVEKPGGSPSPAASTATPAASLRSLPACC
jgi:hypothetical protein